MTSRIHSALRLAGLLLACAGSIPAAHATDSENYYVGATLGSAFVIPRDATLSVTRNNNSGGTSGGIFAGARLGELPVFGGWPLGIEVGYQNIASSTINYISSAGTTALTVSGRSLYAAGRMDIPVSDRFSFYGKLGIARTSVDGTTVPGQPVIDVDGRSTGALVGLGAEYRFANRVSLRTEFTSFGRSSRNSDAGALNVGLSYRF